MAYDNVARQHAGETGNVRYNFESVEKAKAAAAAAVVVWEQMYSPLLPKPKRKPKRGFYGVTTSECEWNAAITLARHRQDPPYETPYQSGSGSSLRRSSEAAAWEWGWE